MDIYQNGVPVNIDSFYFPNHALELFIKTSNPLIADNISLTFNTRPVGTNGLPVTDWASTLPIGKKIPIIRDLSVIPINSVIPDDPVIPVDSVISSLADQQIKNEIELTVTPNPASHQMTFILENITLKSNDSPELLIYTTTGVLVYRDLPTQKTATGVNYDITQRLPNGIYIGAVRTAAGVVTRKFVIQ